MSHESPEAQSSLIERTDPNPPSVRPLVASDDFRRGQSVGTQLGADGGARCGAVQRQVPDFYCVHGDLIVVRVVADRRARTAILRNPEIVAPLARACGQIS